MLNISVSIIPLGFCIFYPMIGTVISIAGAISGFFMIYVVPVFTYLKMKKLEIDTLDTTGMLSDSDVSESSK